MIAYANATAFVPEYVMTSDDVKWCYKRYQQRP